MSESLVSGVDLIHPTASGLGVITTDQVWVLFDREIDETTIAGGNFFVTGPDSDTWIGPDLQLFHDTVNAGSGEDDILESPGFEGIVQGEISFERYDLLTESVVTTLDVIGSGHLYRTRAIFTPTNRLQSNTEYLAHLSGDEDDTDTLQTGLSERTVFDTVSSGANVGTGVATFEGGYIGLVTNDSYHVTITTAGDVGDAKFTFFRNSDPLSVFGPFKTRRAGVLLSDGVTVEFSDGTYSVGDKWSVVTRERTIFTGNLVWPFQTGSGSILTIPDSTSTTVLGDTTPATVVADTGDGVGTGTFTLQSNTPTDNATNVTIPTGPFQITATFSDPVDATTVVSGVSVSVFSEPVNGDPDIAADGLLISNPTVVGSVITIDVADNQLRNNNLVTVTFDSTVSGTDGTSLGQDVDFEFTTQYDPLYCSERKLRLDIGAFISDVSSDTVHFAIFEASLIADHLTWNKSNLDDDYYKFARSQWTSCKAAEILLMNVTGASGQLKSKKLGDLSVEFDTTNADVSAPLKRALACLDRWEGVLMAGGRQVQHASMVVKGDLDVDRPPIGRGWLHTRDIHNAQVPAGNRRLKLNTSRRYRNLYSRHSHSKGWWDK